MNAHISVWTLSLSILSCVWSAVSSAEYPVKPIRVVTAAVGGGADFTARLIAPALGASLGQPVIVDNRPGIATIPTMIVAKAPADGYTLLFSGGGIIYGPLLQHVPRHPLQDLTPVIWTDTSHSILAVHPTVAASSVKELIALAKARPGGINYSTGATGTTSHLEGELFQYLAGINLLRVPYQGGAGALTAVLSGEVQVGFISAKVASGYLKSARMRALAITSAKPSPFFPDLPTLAATVPGYESNQLTAVFAPGNTPATIVDRLNKEIVRTLNIPEIKQRFFNDKIEVVGSSPAVLGGMIKGEIARWTKVIDHAGIRAE